MFNSYIETMLQVMYISTNVGGRDSSLTKELSTLGNYKSKSKNKKQSQKTTKCTHVTVLFLFSFFFSLTVLPDSRDPIKKGNMTPHTTTAPFATITQKNKKGILVTTAGN